MRGKRRSNENCFYSAGLIPAYAGKTDDAGGIIPLSRAHPRVCGENSRTRNGRWSMTGSSPRMRGKHLAALDAVETTRLIPAYAGKTIRHVFVFSP